MKKAPPNKPVTAIKTEASDVNCFWLFMNGITAIVTAVSANEQAASTAPAAKNMISKTDVQHECSGSENHDNMEKSEKDTPPQT